MAEITKSEILKTYTTIIGASLIKDIQSDLFINSALQNVEQVSGQSFTNGVEKISVTIRPILAAVERDENTAITYQDYTLDDIEIAITHRPTVPTKVTSQADEFSKHGDVRGAVSGLLRINYEASKDAIKRKLETDILRDVALDTDVTAGNKFNLAATGTVLNWNQALFENLDERLFDSEAPIGQRKIFTVTGADYSALKVAPLFSNQQNNQNAVITRDYVYLPAQDWYVKRSKYLHVDTVTSKRVRVAMTDDSVCLGGGQLREIINKTVGITREQALNFRLDVDGDMDLDLNKMALTTSYGVKVFQPKAVFLIQNA